MGEVIRYVANQDVAIGATCLFLGSVLIPICALKFIALYGVRLGKRWSIPFFLGWGIWFFGCISSASILSNIDCERRTHHPCDESDIEP